MLHQNLNTFQVLKYRPKRLSAFIDSFLVYHFMDDIPVILNPEGHFELIFQIDGNFSQNNINAFIWQSRPAFFIGGLHNTSFAIRPENKQSKLISVIFKPHCARYFIPDKLHLFKNKLVDMLDVFGVSKMNHIEVVQKKMSIESKLDIIESFLMDIYTKRSASTIEKALSKIIKQNGFIQIDQLAQLSCLSNSQFRKRFNEEVGMSPKEYSKVIRSKFITQVLRKNPQLKLTELTYELGYFDQAHFIKDFKSVTGYSPKHFQKAN